MDSIGASLAADTVVNGTTRDRIGFPLRYARWMERIEAALREEIARVAQGHARDLVAFDHHAAAMAAAIAQCRRDCTEIIALRAATEIQNSRS